MTMKGIEKTTPRDLFDELIEGLTALAESRRGDRLLPTHSVEIEASSIASKGFRLRDSLNLS
jgi:hypothetical protein